MFSPLLMHIDSFSGCFRKHNKLRTITDYIHIHFIEIKEKLVSYREKEREKIEEKREIDTGRLIQVERKKRVQK